MTNSRIRTYSELAELDSFLERYEYLALRGQVGCETFGFDRWINQRFYTSPQWRRIRRDVIARDEGCDLGVLGRDIHSRIIVHHLNPLTQDDIVHGTSNALNPEYMISTTHDTHNAIHYGDATLLRQDHIPRRPGDTQLWQRNPPHERRLSK
jgi:5-methylcytosine-specific restriction endonuclease McrA